MKILHIINSLDIGGAEQMLVKLSKAQAFAKEDILVVTLLDAGALASQIEAYDRDVISLGLGKNPGSWLSLLRLASIINKFKPDIIQSWLYQSDLVAGIMGWLANVPVIWGVRQSNLSVEHNKLSTRIVIRLCALLSGMLPSQIISNSDKARYVHIQAGYTDKFSVIPNGFDTQVFLPSPGSFSGLRAELSIPPESVIVGMVGRFNSQKNHAGFFEAASIIHKNMPEVHFCLAGAGINAANHKLMKMITVADIPASHLHLLDARDDIAYLMAGFDVHGLPSAGESFPNVVGEAMASGVPCVVTDVGDCAQIVGDTGRVVRAGDMRQFATEIISLLSLSATARKQLGKQARKRIETNYSLEHSASRFREIYLSAIAQKR